MPELHWMSYEGVRRPISRVGDRHLANIWLWVNTHDDYQGLGTITKVRQEITRRGLGGGFLMRAPYPHKDRYGHWAILHPEKMRPVFMSEETARMLGGVDEYGGEHASN